SVENIGLEPRAVPGDYPAAENDEYTRSVSRKGCIRNVFTACFGGITSAPKNDKKKEKKMKKQRTQTDDPKPYQRGLINKAIDGIGRHTLNVGVKVWDAYISFGNWAKAKSKQRAGRKQNKAKPTAGQGGDNGGLNHAQGSHVSSSET
ncbi:uncharacterized protein PgNI_01972, partial [Pyricularia grisea]|uniref:Uncharacterized protein n=1 Tax=Pyricularia grisea TaxID=148305 RepID=A0A6P8BM18_PYRGI